MPAKTNHRTHFKLPDEIKEVLRERINILIYRAGNETWTQLAAEIGISSEALADIRSGRRVPTLAILLKLCDYTKVTPNWFLGYAKVEDEVLTVQLEGGEDAQDTSR